MRRVGVSLFCLVLCGFCHTLSKAAQGDEISQLVGNWSGESVCVNREKYTLPDRTQVRRVKVKKDE